MPQPGNFDSLPFPMQVMLFRKMQAEQQQSEQMQRARGQAGNVLYGQFGGQPQPQGMPPPPPMQAPPQPVLQPAPPPGTLSPGGGNPMAQGGASAMAPQPQPQQGMMPPPPSAGPMPAGGASPAAAAPAPAPAARTMAPIQPFRAMPSAPQQAPGMAGEVPPPPMSAGGAAAGPAEPRPLDLKSIVMGLKGSGVPAEQVMNVLDTLAPTMNTQNKQELNAIKAETAAQTAAANAYKAEMSAWKAGHELELKRIGEERKGEQAAERVRHHKATEALMKARLEAAVGGAGNLKTVEYVYPKGPDGRPDTTQPPIGTRGTTKTGKIINLDTEGHQVPTQAGATVKDDKATQVNVKDTVRANIVKAGVVNALNRLDEIQKQHPTGATSIFFGQSGDNPVTRGVYGAGQGMQTKAQQDIDAKWAAFIDEAIPVFTGGLRGSDAFRRFLIEQAPGPGAKKETITEKMRLFRENIEGTSKAFFNKYSSDPSFWGPGVKPEEVQGGAAAAPKPGAGRAPKPPAAGAVQDGYRFKGGDPSKRENWEKVQ